MVLDQEVHVNDCLDVKLNDERLAAAANAANAANASTTAVASSSTTSSSTIPTATSGVRKNAVWCPGCNIDLSEFRVDERMTHVESCMHLASQPTDTDVDTNNEQNSDRNVNEQASVGAITPVAESRKTHTNVGQSPALSPAVVSTTAPSRPTESVEVDTTPVTPNSVPKKNNLNLFELMMQRVKGSRLPGSGNKTVVKASAPKSQKKAKNAFDVSWLLQIEMFYLFVVVVCCCDDNVSMTGNKESSQDSGNQEEEPASPKGTWFQFQFAR